LPLPPPRLCALLVGRPGTGKTGSLCSLLEAGYNIRLIDLDRNLDPIVSYSSPSALKNIAVTTIFESHIEKPFTIGMGGTKQTITRIVPVGAPKSYSKIMGLLDNFVDDDGVSYGPVKSWGPKDFLVLDSLTALGRICMERTLFMRNRQALGPRIQDWGEASSQQGALIEAIKEKAQGCNVLVTAHLKIIDPKFLGDVTDDDTDEDQRKKIVEAMNKSVSLIPPRLYPSAIGRALPQDIGSYFPAILRYQEETVGALTKRVITFDPAEDCDVKLPVAGLKGKLPIETGLLTIMKKLQGS
jgi:hypothetical protein